MLKQRIVTALVLAIAFLSALFIGSELLFLTLVGCLLFAGIYEWGGLAELPGPSLRYLFAAALIAVLLAISSTSEGLLRPDAVIFAARAAWITGAALLFWLVALSLVLSYPRTARLWRARGVRLVFGVLVLSCAWVSLVYLCYRTSGAQVFILYVVLIVAAADIGAYFSGRQWGKNKLAPTVSPGKSWEGVVGGLLLVTLVAYSFFTIAELPGVDLLPFIVVSQLMAAASVVGDLFESMLKRYAGIKDSGSLLPGHGGVLDRIDGLVAALPVFVFSCLQLGW